MRRRRSRLAPPLLVGLALACGGPDSGAPPATGTGVESRPAGPAGARWDIVEMLRADAESTHHPSDGGGRAWLEAADPVAPRASQPGRFDLAFEVGPEGIASGGVIYLQVSPFWGWSTPQVEAPDAPGFTRVESEADDALLEPETLDDQLLAIRNAGRPLAPGEVVRIAYGAGPAGAYADEFAERDSRFWFAVDGDGDGLRKVLSESPGIDVAAGPPARLIVTAPSIVRPGEPVPLAVAVLDPRGSRGVEVEGEIALEASHDALEVPERLVLARADAGVGRALARARGPGVVRVTARGPAGLEAVSNPIVVSGEGPRILWGDLHGHSALSDGTGTAEDYFRYARDVAALDAVSLTDHDHWGILQLDERPALWEEIREQTRRFHEPGRFVTILGFEWTSWIHGHRHVLYFGDDGEVFSSADPDYESPQQLWEALEGRAALTFAHHSAGGPIATNWDVAPDPRFEPLTEIVSVHGSSEALDSPGVIYSPVPGNFVRDALDRGYRLGFVGSGDSHDGHPGLAQLASPSGGLAAILAEERTREGVLAALRARRVYATNGPRIVLRTALGPHPMGTVVPAPAGGAVSESLFVHVIGTGPLDRVELVRSGELADGVLVEGREEVTLQRPVDGLRPGEYVYVRAVQEDGGAAWSSPIWVAE
jgi:hypothetical protein